MQDEIAADSVDQDNATWTDEENVFHKYDEDPASFESAGIGDYSGDLHLYSSFYVPTAINHFKMIFWNSSGTPLVNDTFNFYYFDVNLPAWVYYNLSLADSETEYVDGAFLTEIQTAFAAAADKQLWVNNFAIRFFIDVLKTTDDVILSTKGMLMEIEYTAAPGGPKGPLGHPLNGPFGGPI